MAHRALACGALLSAAVAVGVAGQGGLPTLDREQAAFSLRVVTTGLAHPWEIVWGPDDHLWVTERSGKRITRVNPSDGSRTVLADIPDVYQSVGQDGLLGMVLDPGLLRGGGADYVYVAYTYDADPGPDLRRRLKIRRYTYDPGARLLGSPVEVLADLPAHDDHVAGRLAMGSDRTLWLAIGDQGSNWGTGNFCNPNRAQDLPTSADVAARDWTTYQGKILRVRLDGSIPPDNPAIAGVRSHVYSYGHRNPQGLVVGSDGTLYSAEHGPNSDDEVNLIRAGGNYGWPHVAGYRDDRGYEYMNWSASKPNPCRALTFSGLDAPPPVPRQKETDWSHADFKPPIATFFTVGNDYDFRARGAATIAASGMDLYTGVAIPGWAPSLLVLSLSRGAVYRLKLNADLGSADGPPLELFKSTDRFRDVAISRDGTTIYFATDNNGRTIDAAGAVTQTLQHPGAILAFSYDASR